MTDIYAVVFDAYDTLFDTVSASRRHAPRLGAGWEAFSTLWRTKQFEYALVRSLAGDAHHVDFARVVDHSLAFAATSYGITDTALLAELRDSFDNLEMFSDVAPALEAILAKKLGRAILSNGTPSALGRQVRASKIDGLLDAVLSVEAVGVFKPDPRVYRLAVAEFGVEPEQLAFVSSNPWDVFGARAFGMQAIWVNRRSRPDEYGLRGKVTELGDLSELPAALD